MNLSSVGYFPPLSAGKSGGERKRVRERQRVFFFSLFEMKK